MIGLVSVMFQKLSPSKFLHLVAIITVGLFLFFIPITGLRLPILFLFVLMLLWDGIESAGIGKLFNVKKRTNTYGPQEAMGGSDSASKIIKLTKSDHDSINTISIAAVHFDQGRQLMAANDWSAAEPHFKMALWSDPNHWLAAMYLGFIYGESGGNTKFDLGESIFYSTLATKIDSNHYNQFMNLALAQLHSDSADLHNKSLINFDRSFIIISTDSKNRDHPVLQLQLGKAKIFKAEALEKLAQKSEAIKHYKDGQKIFVDCPEPKPDELKKWIDQTTGNLNRLESS